MKNSIKKMFKYLLLIFIILISVFFLCFVSSSSFRTKIIIKLNWGIWIPLGSEVYTDRDLRNYYTVYQYSPSNEKKIIKKLDKQDISHHFESILNNHLSYLKVSPEWLPPYEEIDYTFGKTSVNNGYLYLLYSTSTLKLYVMEAIG